MIPSHFCLFPHLLHFLLTNFSYFELSHLQFLGINSLLLFELNEGLHYLPPIIRYLGFHFAESDIKGCYLPKHQQVFTDLLKDSQ